MDKAIVTTSWDDGHRLDARVADLLHRYRVTGTFYIPCNYLEEPLEAGDIVQLGAEFEIGAHSLTHRRLDCLDREEARNEIEGSKAYLEDVLSRSVNMFCYPGGYYSLDTVDIVREAGFVGARTTEKFVFHARDPYALGTTVHCYPYPFRKVSRDRYMLGRRIFQPIQQSWRQVWPLRFPVSAYFNWSRLAQATFDYALKNGGIWHLWGHSWELEQYGMWGELESILRYVSNHSGVFYLTNSEVVQEIINTAQ